MRVQLARLDGLAQQPTQPAGWVRGAPSPPRVSWSPIPCSKDEELGAKPSDKCWNVFRGDQFEIRAKAPVARGVELQLFSNDFRNRRTLLVTATPCSQRSRRGEMCRRSWRRSMGSGSRAAVPTPPRRCCSTWRIWSHGFDEQVPVGVHAEGVISVDRGRARRRSLRGRSCRRLTPSDRRTQPARRSPAGWLRRSPTSAGGALR